MEYKVLNNLIQITGKEDFNPKHILECGQIFRFKREEDGSYIVNSLDKQAKIVETEGGFNITTKNPNYFVEFFDLNTDYSQIKKEIVEKLPFMKGVIEKSPGLRILKQDFFEMVVSFIISANNNIKRIKLIIDRICSAIGKWEREYSAFPTKEEFFKLDVNFFKEIGAGYRAGYLANLKDSKNLLDKEVLSVMSTITLRENLLKIKGVGPKVADCILLFAFNRLDVFPVDVWMERVYYEFFDKEKRTRPQISAYLTNAYGNLSGYIQQYLFYYKTVKN